MSLSADQKFLHVPVRHRSVLRHYYELSLEFLIRHLIAVFIGNVVYRPWGLVINGDNNDKHHRLRFRRHYPVDILEVVRNSFDLVRIDTVDSARMANAVRHVLIREEGVISTLVTVTDRVKEHLISAPSCSLGSGCPPDLLKGLVGGTDEPSKDRSGHCQVDVFVDLAVQVAGGHRLRRPIGLRSTKDE